jgi:hypothetical protein
LKLESSAAGFAGTPSIEVAELIVQP